MIVLFSLLTTFAMVGVVFADGPTVSEGTVSGTEDLGGVRYRAFNRTSEKEIYLGVNVDYTGNPGRRIEKEVNWIKAGDNTIVFVYDQDQDELVTVVNGTSVATYTNYSTQVSNLGKDTDLLDHLNVMQITVVNRNVGAIVNLVDVHLDGNALGDFETASNSGWNNWSVTDYNFSQGFTLTGTLELSGTLSTSAETNKVQLNFGYAPGNLDVTKVVDWQGTTPDASRTFEICINGPSYPDGDCQTVDYDGTTLSWTDLHTGIYTVTETSPGSDWSVDISSSVTNVQPAQTAAVTVTNSYVSGANPSGNTIFLPVIFAN